MAAPTPARIWTSFLPETALPEQPPTADLGITRYRIDAVEPIRGDAAIEWQPGTTLLRLESSTKTHGGRGVLSGVTGHVLYTTAAERSELAALSASPAGPNAVLIPIRKSAAWWALAQDERLAIFHGQGGARGHYVIGKPHAARIFRRLYHCRYLQEASWDFLTYFEFSDADAPHFRELLAELRDPEQNPEWRYVEAELELRLQKLV